MRTTDAQPRPKKVKLGSAGFKSEAELCDAFAARARATGWEVYPEVSGWDLLLVWTGDAPIPSPACAYDHMSVSFYSKVYAITQDWDGTLKPGDQLGLQAKLHPNLQVLSQGISDLEAKWKGPDFRGVLVPHTNPEFNLIASQLGLRVYVENTERDVILPPLVRWRTGGKVWVPPVVPTWSGGLPGPRTLSKWRVGALRLCARLRAGSELSKDDFKAAGIEHRTWVSRGWVTGSRVGKDYRYRLGRNTDLPDAGYEAERDLLAKSSSSV